MTKKEISVHYTAKDLEAIAKKLPNKSDVKKMYQTIESIARIIIGEVACCAAYVIDPNMKKNAKEHLDEANQWGYYLAEKTSE